MTGEITPAQFQETPGLGDWRVLGDGGCAHFRTASLAESVRFVQAISELPAAREHPPDIDIRPGGVTVRVVTVSDDYFGMSEQDATVARQVSGIAHRLGLTPDPSALQSLLIIPGAKGIAGIMPFWRAVLGYEPRPDSPEEDLVDPHGRGTALWFEEMDDLRADGGGNIHVAVWVPAEQAEARVAAALAAGGQVVRDDYAPAWWTLADSAGNEVDIATISSRD